MKLYHLQTLLLLHYVYYVGLIAGLPQKLPSNQRYVNPFVDSGDTAWMIVATILGFILSPALAFLYGNHSLSQCILAFIFILLCCC